MFLPKAYLALALCAPLAAQPTCASYPQSVRQELLDRLTLERAAQSFSLRASKTTQQRQAVSRNNFIDEHIFSKMAADGVPSAPLTTDAEFIRRVTLDLTGRIPLSENVEAFLADERPNKRAILIDELIASEAFNDFWTFFYANQFEVISRYYNMIGVPGRNLFHQYLRGFVEKDRPLTDLATEMITATGDNYLSGPVNYLVRGWQDGDPIQDTWDTLTDRTTSRFLGIKTECISCHDGRRHLEQINLYLTNRKRDEFMRQSAFFSRMNMIPLPVDSIDPRRKVIVTDRPSGAYYTVVNINNPGPRPLRPGGPYEPAFLLTGEEPTSPDWRRELARMLTSERQFARAAVNYLWARMFTTGIVDPPDGWDLARIDPRNPPPAPWSLQPTHPALIEALADEFIRSGYRFRPIIRLMAESSSYQLSSRYEGQWRPEYSRYFAKHQPRRLMAEEIYDALTIATLSETPMLVDGISQPLLYATQLPDSLEPLNDFSIRNFLANFGRGDWWRLPRSSGSTTLQVLYMMNDAYVNNRTFAVRGGVAQNNRVGWLMRSGMSDADAIRHLYLATLGRHPTEDEMATVTKYKTPNREQWLTDLQWALLNKLDFLFNY
jgi:hypothetical protein